MSQEQQQSAPAPHDSNDRVVRLLEEIKGILCDMRRSTKAIEAGQKEPVKTRLPKQEELEDERGLPGGPSGW